MCVLAFAWNAHPRWRLVMAGNRDEFHDRPAAPLARWEAPDHVLAGRDLKAGGTWAGVSEEGRFTVMTNLRGFGPPAAGLASRGELVANLLSGDGPYDDPMRLDPAAFNPFNLIVADPFQARFLTNRPLPLGRRLGLTRAPIRPRLLEPGLYGLSNGALDAPWPKTVRLKAALRDWLARDADEPAALFTALSDDSLPPADPAAPPSDVPQEAPQSPVFIRNPVYGTRCSTIVAIDADGAGQIIEQSYDAEGELSGRSWMSFRWPPMIVRAEL